MSLPLNISFWPLREGDWWEGAGRPVWRGLLRDPPSYLGLRHDGILRRGSTEEGGQWGGDDDGIWPEKATQVTAGDGVLLSLHHQGVCGIKAIPRQPHGALLAHEWGSLEVQGQGGAPVGDQVKPGEGQMGSLRSEHTFRQGRCSDLHTWGQRQGQSTHAGERKLGERGG